MSNHKWQIGPVKLANGEDAFIDAINEGQERYRYTGRMRGQDGFLPVGWHSDGRLMWATAYHPGNLAPPPKKTVRVQFSINVHSDGAFYVYKTRVDAKSGAGVNRMACKEIDIEVEEGEGL